MKIYIAAPYPWRELAAEYGRHLQDAGHIVTATWLWEAEDDEAPDKKEQYALLDLADIDRAEALLLISGYRGERAYSGGRHVEFGYALAKGKRCFILGPKEGVFHWLASVQQRDSFEDLLALFSGGICAP